MYYPAASVLGDAKLIRTHCDLHLQLKEMEPEKDHFDTLLSSAFYCYRQNGKHIPLDHYIGAIQSALNGKTDKQFAKLYFHVFSYWLRQFTFQFKKSKHSRTPEPLKQLCHFLLNRASMFGGTHETWFLEYDNFSHKWERSLSDSWKWLDKNKYIWQLPNIFSGMFSDKIEKMYPEGLKEIQEELQQIEKRNSEILD